MLRTRRIAAVATICLLAASCGTRRSHDDVVAAARGGTTGAAVSPGAGAVAGVTPGDASNPRGATTDVAGAAGAGSAAGGDATSTGGGTATGGTSGAPGGTGGSASAAAGSAAVTSGSPIRVGVVGTLSGPAGASLKPLSDGVRIWAKAVNDKGGVNGHQVEVLVADDGGDPARHRSLVQEFVEQRKVMAFVANPEALTGEGSVDYLTKAGVPVIGSEMAGQYFYESPDYFPQGSHGNALAQASMLAIATAAKEKKFTKVASITCVEVKVCRDAYDQGPRLASKYGLQMVYRAQASLGQPDFTAECLNAQRAGAQVMSMGMDANAVRAIAQACSRQGYHPLYSFTSGIAIGAHAQDPNLNGALVTTSVGPWTDGNTPGRKEFQDAMARYAKGVSIGGGHMLGWAAGKVFELGAKDLPEPPTAKAVLDGLGRIHGDVLADLTGPLLFSPGKPAQPTVCSFTVTISGGKFVTGMGGTRLCDNYDPSLF